VSAVVRTAADRDIAAIRRIGVEADQRFVDIGLPALADGTTIPEEAARSAIAEGRLLVAEVEGEVAGWVYLGRIEGELCIGQISVALSQGKKGLGSMLLQAVIDAARAKNEPSIVLSTQREVPWNAPWYARHGFVEIPREAWTPALAAVTESQTKAGLDWSSRVHMRLTLR
jgi:predicted N-acetyltransferase YhbS